MIGLLRTFVHKIKKGTYEKKAFQIYPNLQSSHNHSPQISWSFNFELFQWKRKKKQTEMNIGIIVKSAGHDKMEGQGSEPIIFKISVSLIWYKRTEDLPSWDIFIYYTKSVFCVGFLTIFCNLRTIKICILRRIFNDIL